MTATVCSRISIASATVALLCSLSTSLQAQTYIKGERPQQRGYSLAVITEGGKTVWLAGQTATRDEPSDAPAERGSR